jgi:hypothetical protein
VALAVSDHDELVEQEPNNDAAHANRVPVPGGISARFLEPGDVDYFVFALKKGQRYVIEAQTQELYSPTEVYLTLKDAKGGQLAVSNPQVAPRIDYTPTADGDYTLVVEHLLLVSGPSETYRVTITPYQPGFDLTLGIDRFDLAAGGSVPIALFVTRRDYAGPIEVAVTGHPGLSGHVTIPAGQPPAPNVPAATLFLLAKPDAPPGAYRVMLQGSATFQSETIVQYADLRALVSQNLAGLTYPPRDLFHDVGLAVTPRPPFTLVAKGEKVEATRGVAASLTVHAERAAGFDEDVLLTPLNLPANVAAAVKNIPKGHNEVEVQITPAANAALGTFHISFTGKTKFQNKEFSLNAAPISLVVDLPFGLQMAPSPVKLAPGAKAKITVSASRKGGYQGPIAVELRNLPANVTAPKATIAQGLNTVEIEITAAANAAPGDKGDVNVLGTAPAAANQQNASANFTVSIGKK